MVRFALWEAKGRGRKAWQGWAWRQEVLAACWGVGRCQGTRGDPDSDLPEPLMAKGWLPLEPGQSPEEAPHWQVGLCGGQLGEGPHGSRWVLCGKEVNGDFCTRGGGAQRR